MKAKLHYAKLKECATEEAFYEAHETMMYDLVKDVEVLIKSRNAKRRDAVEACIKEVNDKYRAICRLHEKYQKEVDYGHFIKTIKFLDDGFKAIYVDLHPEHKWAFDLKKHCEKVDKMREEIKRREEQEKERESSLFIHPVTPFEDLTMENITKEILCCMAALGSYASSGMPLQYMKKLAFRITLLRYWKDNGSINLDDVKEWEEDPEKWAKSHNLI